MGLPNLTTAPIWNLGQDGWKFSYTMSCSGWFRRCFLLIPRKFTQKNVLFLHTKGGSTIPHIDLPKINNNSALKFLHLGRPIPKLRKQFQIRYPLFYPTIFKGFPLKFLLSSESNPGFISGDLYDEALVIGKFYKPVIAKPLFTNQLIPVLYTYQEPKCPLF